jgi:hypothetical protein
MANYRTSFSSLAELKKLAESYKTRVLPFVEQRQTSTYTIADISKEEFDNISTFLLNSVIKDSKIIELSESTFSLEFSKYLKKYFDESLSLKDIIDLKKFVNKYNKIAFSYMYNNIFSHVFGINSESQGIDLNGFFGKLTSNIKNKVKYLVDNYSQPNEKKTVAEWFGSTDDTLDVKFTAREFYNSYFLKSNITEAIVLLVIISYLNDNDGGAGLYTVSSNTIVRDQNLTFRNENYFNEDLLNFDIKDFIFSNETATIDFFPTANKRIVQSLIIKDSNNRIVLSIPYKLINGLNPTPEEIYNFVDFSGNSVSFDDLFSSLRSNLLSFIDLIKKVDGDANYNLNLNYFLDGSNRTLVSNIVSDIKEVSKIFYTKDLIIENFYLTATEELKNSANLFEISLAQSMEQLTFIDVKGVDFSNSELLAEAKSLFLDELGTDIRDETTITNKLTYTILYKELNPALRNSCLSDVQEYVFARLFSSLNYDKSLIFESNKKGVSFLDTVNTLYKSYRENKEIFLIDSSFNRYKYFLNNVYMSRISEESDIIGYYVGDATAESAFVNNYGSRDYHRFEITQFLDIYKTSRDYYYKVLLNKSFIFEDGYSLYEKLIISWIAVERFLTSKIDNLKDPDFFNSEDIFNFLESYGLGILNQFSFFFGSKDFKTSIIKNFTNLRKFKGSKDIINLLLDIFEVRDATIEINKFLLVDQLNFDDLLQFKIFKISTTNNFIFIDGSFPSGIQIYNPDRVYYHNGTFKTSNGTVATVSTDYVFDEENYILYTKSGNVLTQKVFTFTNREPSALVSGVVVYNELNEVFYIGTSTTPSAITSITRVSVVDTLPAITTARNILSNTRGSIYMLTGSIKFYEKVTNGWENLKVSDYYPEVIKNNVGLNITGNSTLSETLEKYNNYLFYIRNSVTNEIELYEYLYFSNTISRIDIIQTLSLPKEPGIIDIPFWRVLIKQGYITRYEYETFNPTLYRLVSDNEEGNNVYININDYVNNYFGSVIGSNYVINSTTFGIRSKNIINSDELKFIEVPYSSENGTREILRSIPLGVKYIPFLERSENEKNDIYWTKENVSEELLKDSGVNINTVETKYLSLTISENIYRRYVIARYMLSAIEYLEDKFVITGNADSVVTRIRIDSGASLFSEVSLYDFFQAIKIQYKALLKMYEVQGKDPNINPLVSPTFKRYYGINTDYDWASIETYLSSKINNFSSISGEFLTDSYKVGTDAPVSYDKFNLYEKTSEYFSFGTDRSYKKDNIVSNAKELNNVSLLLKNSLYSTHKINREISQENSGEFVLDLFENLNTIRIEDGDNLWNYFLSKFYDNDYSPINNDVLAPQIGNSLPDKSELYFKIIEKMVIFPIQYFDGLLNQAYTIENINLNKDFVELAELVFKDVYTVEADEDPAFFIKTEFEEESPIASFLAQSLSILADDFSYPNDDEEFQELISEASERLFLTIDSLSLIFASEQFMQLSFSLKENERQTLGFVETAIKLFLSYTTQLYSSSFRRKYDTISESTPLSERVIHTLESNRLDMVFYDEKLDIREE